MYQRPDTLPLRELAKEFRNKLRKIKVFLCDVDGVLTDGKIHWASEEVGFVRSFHTQDGYGLKLLENHGIKVGILSGGASIGLMKRLDTIGVTYSFLGNENKMEAYKTIIKDSGAKESEILYIGDEYFDLPILKRVGFSVTVPHASLEIQESVDYVTARAGGEACVREVIDMVFYSKGVDLTKNIYTEKHKTQVKKTTKKRI